MDVSEHHGARNPLGLSPRRPTLVAGTTSPAANSVSSAHVVLNSDQLQHWPVRVPRADAPDAAGLFDRTTSPKTALDLNARASSAQCQRSQHTWHTVVRKVDRKEAVTRRLSSGQTVFSRPYAHGAHMRREPAVLALRLAPRPAPSYTQISKRQLARPGSSVAVSLVISSGSLAGLPPDPEDAQLKAEYSPRVVLLSPGMLSVVSLVQNA